MRSSLARSARIVAVAAIAAALLTTAGLAVHHQHRATASSSSASVSCPSSPTRSHALGDLADPADKDIALQLVSSAENSSLDWRAQYKYLQDIADGRGYSGGLIGFTSGTGDMLQLVQNYTDAQPDNPLAPFIPALQAVNGSDSHDGLGAPFERAWLQAATDSRYRAGFEQAQDDLRDSLYFNPAVALAKSDGLPTLGQFAYYDAAVVHGPGHDPDSLGGIRSAALQQARTPAQGGDLRCYLDAFWQARIAVMKKEPAHTDVSRITDLEERFANDGNYTLQTPLSWQVYGDAYTIP